MEKNDIIIRNAIIHIVNGRYAYPVLSDELAELGPDLNDFIRNHIDKVISCDEVKKCRFKEESLIADIIQQFSENTMVQNTQDIARILHGIMNANIDIPEADLLAATYQLEGTMFLALLKLNYKEVFNHVSGKGNGKTNEVVKQISLPASSSRLKEAALINLSTMEIELVEKKYEVNGVKTNYFSSMFLECISEASEKTKYGALAAAIKKVNSKFFEEDVEKQMEIKSILQEKIADAGEVAVLELVEEIYQSDEAAKETFFDVIDKYQIRDEMVQVQSPTVIKKLERQFILTDEGIEISIPMEVYKRNAVLFSENPDGSMVITLNHIHGIKVR